jgi:hypothetical protein
MKGRDDFSLVEHKRAEFEPVRHNATQAKLNRNGAEFHAENS